MKDHPSQYEQVLITAARTRQANEGRWERNQTERRRQLLADLQIKRRGVPFAADTYEDLRPSA
jgi:hypothetical protein